MPQILSYSTIFGIYPLHVSRQYKNDSRQSELLSFVYCCTCINYVSTDNTDFLKSLVELRLENVKKNLRYFC